MGVAGPVGQAHVGVPRQLTTPNFADCFPEHNISPPQNDVHCSRVSQELTYFGLLAGFLILALLAEAALHRRSRGAIRHRIHVNGIRGKSSVTRLIAAGLRAGGFHTWAKVTGTRPNLIDETGRDIRIRRFAGPRLSEQRAVVYEAAKRNVEALVLECMALQPINQAVSEDTLVAATVGVITNIRRDHLEVFGPSLAGVAEALAATVPRRGVLITVDGPGLEVLRASAAARDTRLVIAQAQDVDDDALKQLPYLEHRENVAIALRVCDELGVPRDVALQGMTNVQPDAGALTIVDVQRQGKTLHVVNGLAANDPDSTQVVYNAHIAGRWACRLFVIVNTRRDRPLRSLQLGTMLRQLPAHAFFVDGNDAAGVRLAALDAGIAAEILIDAFSLSTAQLIEQIVARTEDEAVVFAIGNTAGRGLTLIDELVASGPAEQGD